MSNQPYQWKREVRCGGKRFTTQGKKNDISQSITVTQSKDGLRFSVVLYNLSRESWEAIKVDDPIEIALGYADGVFETVILGLVEERKSPTTTGADTKYKIRGTDKSEGRLRGTYWHKVWNQPTVERMVRDIAYHADLGVGRCEIPEDQPFDRRYQVNERRPLSRWLDRFAKEAKERDSNGRKFDWRARAGTLFFGPEEEPRRRSAVVFKQATPSESGNILAGGLERSDGTTGKSDGPPGLDFEVMLDPRIEKDTLVTVQNTDTYDGVYQVKSYEHSSSVRDGTHKTTGTMVGKSAEYRESAERAMGSGI